MQQETIGSGSGDSNFLRLSLSGAAADFSSEKLARRTQSSKFRGYWWEVVYPIHHQHTK